MNPDFPLRTAIAGIGGFGAAHHKVFEDMEVRHMARVIATCDPMLDQLGEICQRHRFVQRGVETFRDFAELLDAHRDHLDLGVVAAPIQFHAPMHEAFVQNQIACYLEKPPTLDPEELQRMLVVEEKAVVPTNVGFSYVHMPERLALKRRMLEGEFGALKGMSFLGLTQRSPSYFRRNNWAGKLVLNEKLLLDSCLGNAMAHFLNSMLFFGNQSQLLAWARPSEMRCEMYRANPIEGADTIFAICRLDNGVELRMAASHACPNQASVFEETFEFENATLTIQALSNVTIQRPGMSDEILSISKTSLADCVGDYFNFFKAASGRPPQTLSDCLGFVETNALLYLAAGQIHDLPFQALLHSHTESAISLPDIESAGRRLANDAIFPSQAGYSWARPGGESTCNAIPELRTVIQEIVNLRG